MESTLCLSPGGIGLILSRFRLLGFVTSQITAAEDGLVLYNDVLTTLFYSWETKAMKACRGSLASATPGTYKGENPMRWIFMHSYLVRPTPLPKKKRHPIPLHLLRLSKDTWRAHNVNHQIFHKVIFEAMGRCEIRTWLIDARVEDGGFAYSLTLYWYVSLRY